MQTTEIDIRAVFFDFGMHFPAVLTALPHAPGQHATPVLRLAAHGSVVD